MTTLREIRDQHEPTYHRRRAGSAAVSGRPLYAWSVSCSCGWKHKTNMDKAGVAEDWRLHTRDIWEAGRRPRGAEAIAKPQTDLGEKNLDPGMADFLLWQKRQAQAKACPCCQGVARWKLPNAEAGQPDTVQCQDCGLCMTGDRTPGSALSKWNIRP